MHAWTLPHCWEKQHQAVLQSTKPQLVTHTAELLVYSQPSLLAHSLGQCPSRSHAPTLSQGMSPVSVHQKWGHMAPAGSLTPTQLGAVHVHIHRALGALASTSSMWPDTFSPAQPTKGPRWQFSSRSPWPLQPDRPGAACLQLVTPHMALKRHFLLPHSLSASPWYLSGSGCTRWAERRSSAGLGQQTA